MSKLSNKILKTIDRACMAFADSVYVLWFCIIGCLFWAVGAIYICITTPSNAEQIKTCCETMCANNR